MALQFGQGETLLRAGLAAMLTLYMENIRSFAGKHTLPIAPLTLLVGENSSGKSTCLATLAAMFSPEQGFPSRAGFNVPPFDFGGYDTIATYKGGKYGRAKRFAIGFSVDVPRSKESLSLTASYQNSLGQPVLSELAIRSGQGNVRLAFEGEQITGRISLGQQGADGSVQTDIDQRLPEGRLLTLANLAPLFFTFLLRDEVSRPFEASRALMDSVFAFLRDIPSYRAVPVAPVRTKPRRTYDPASDEFQPEGDHVPLILARALSATSSAKQRDQLRDALAKFGEFGAFYRGPCEESREESKCTLSDSSRGSGPAVQSV